MDIWGNMDTRRRLPMIKPLYRIRSRARAYPARMAIDRVISVVQPATITLFFTKCSKSYRVKAET